MIDNRAHAPRVTMLLKTVIERARQPRGNGETESETMALSHLLDSLEERAFGLGILILALPCAIPFLYGVPQIVALPMLALAGQLALGREHPWLPDRLAKRTVRVESLAKVVDQAHKTLGFVERLAKPRLPFLSDGVGARLVGGLMLIPAASILVPLPLTNSTPAVGVGLAAMGLLERDGLLILLGLALGIFWVLALLFFGAEAISALKGLVMEPFTS